MNDVYICDYLRTPIGRYGGALSSVRTDDLASIPLKALAKANPDLDLAAVDEVILGCANQAGEDNRNIARMASLLAGYPDTVPGTTMNRLCGSGMDAVITGARAIKAGEADVIIAGGAESMSRAPFVMPKATQAFSRQNEVFDTTIGWRFVNPKMEAQYGIDSMPETAENVAEEFNINREDQDQFAFRSQQKAGEAIKNGRLAKEITPVEIKQRKGDAIQVTQDEHPRPQTTQEDLSGLKPFVKSDGTITAGNASGVNDGSAGLILASEAAIERYNLKPIARVMGGASYGVAPRIMGIGPAPTSQKLMERLGLGIDDFDVIELNEAFASQGLATLRQLGVSDDDERVNPNGGAIALGHPLGMSGARIVGSAALELNLADKKRALATMCIGVGQGIAIAIERV